MKLTALLRRKSTTTYVATGGQVVVPPAPPPPAEPRPAPMIEVVPMPAPNPADDRPSWDPSGRFLRAPRPKLTIASHRLVIELYEDGEPLAGLARRFPHVLNSIAQAAPDADGVVDAIDEMLVDRRGGRRGFPADVLAELLALRTRFAVRSSASTDRG